jgi:hypothetical protein
VCVFAFLPFLVVSFRNIKVKHRIHLKMAM